MDGPGFVWMEGCVEELGSHHQNESTKGLAAPHRTARDTSTSRTVEGTEQESGVRNGSWGVAQ